MANATEQLGAVQQVYARALIELAQESGTIDEVADEVQQVRTLLSQEPDLDALLSSRVLSISERAQSIDTIFKGCVSDLVLRFLQVVNAKNRIDVLGGILRSFEQHLDELRGIVEVDAFVAHRLPDDSAAQVSKHIGDALGKTVVLHQYVDPNLIGGLKIRVGDQLIDGSVATQLGIIKKQLIAAGRQSAREAARAL
jgi:F-type H+-transporting ATPase subunit delta